MNNLWNILVCIAFIFAQSLSGLARLNAEENSHKTETAKGEQEKGPQGGKIFRSEDIAVEIKIVEKNSPPKFNAYVYKSNEPVDPTKVDLRAVLTRIDGEVNKFTFSLLKGVLVGDGIVKEPHSFDVKLQVTFENQTHKWEFESHEGRTNITEKAAKEADLQFEKAGAATINEYTHLTGRVILNRNNTAQVRARFPGIVKSIKVVWGQKVNKGDVLARIEANESLKAYHVVAPVGGIILKRNTNIGDVATDAPLFTIADFSEVWAEFHIFPSDLPRITEGQTTKVYSVDSNQDGKARQMTKSSIQMLLTTVDADTQTVRAIVPLNNNDGQWRPGMVVKGDVLVSTKEVPLAVKTSALQSFIDFTVVFAKFGQTYEVRMLDLGLSDGEMVEVLGGLKPNTEYVSKNSFLIKADIEKSGAGHDH